MAIHSSILGLEITWTEDRGAWQAVGSQERGFLGGSEGKASACNTGNSGSILGWGRSPGEGNSNPLQYPCLENPMDGEAW